MDAEEQKVSLRTCKICDQVVEKGNFTTGCHGCDPDADIKLETTSSCSRPPKVTEPIETVIERLWRVDNLTIVRENPDGTYNIADWHHLTIPELRRVHAVLDYILTDVSVRDSSI